MNELRRPPFTIAQPRQCYQTFAGYLSLSPDISPPMTRLHIVLFIEVACASHQLMTAQTSVKVYANLYFMVYHCFLLSCAWLLFVSTAKLEVSLLTLFKNNIYRGPNYFQMISK